MSCIVVFYYTVFINFYNTCIDPCDEDPCGDYGRCSDLGNYDYRCRCDSGYTGDRCQNLIGKTHCVKCNIVTRYENSDAVVV